MIERNAERQEKLRRLVGLRYSAVAVKMVEDEAILPECAERPFADWGKHIALCQAFAFSRRQGKTLYLRKEDHWCWNPIITYGLIDDETAVAPFKNAAMASGGDPAKAEAFINGFPKLPYGKYKGMLLAPLEKADFEPDVTLIYCKNDQLRLFLQAIDTQTGSMLDSSFTPLDSCTYSVIPSMQDGKYRITLPDPGEYERALTPEDDIILSVPAAREEEFYKGVETQIVRGDRNSFYKMMKEDFERPPFYNMIFEAWGLGTSEVWDKPITKMPSRDN